MTAQPTAGRIDAHDIEELQQIVQPWEVVLRQMSGGKLDARMDFLQVNGLVLYREHWSQRVMATGATPRGYYFFGGPASPRLEIGWCGTVLSTECLAFGRSSAEISFITPEAETHICLLVPENLLHRYLGEEMTARGLAKDRVLLSAQGCGAQLLQMLERILNQYLVHRDLLGNERTCQAIEWQLMGGLVEFLLTRSEDSNTASGLPRANPHWVVRRAIELCNATREPVRVSDLAAACGLSKRVLELKYQKAARTTPSRFLQWHRMHQVRQELLESEGTTTSVTDVLSRWGVTQLGRFAVEYKRLFGESPSSTLRHDIIVPSRRLADALGATS